MENAMNSEITRALTYGRIFVLLIPPAPRHGQGDTPTCIPATRVHPRVPAHVAAAVAVRAHHGPGALALSFVGVIPDGRRGAALFAARVTPRG